MSITGKNVKRAGIETLLANYAPEALAGALVGGGVGALTSKKKRLRNILLGMLGGAGAGVGARYALAGKTIGVANRAADVTGSPLAVRVRYNKGGWKADHLPGAKAGIRAAHEGIDRLEKAKSQVKAKLPKPKKPASDEKKDRQVKSAFVNNSTLLKQAQWFNALRRVANLGLMRGSKTMHPLARRLNRYLQLLGGGSAKRVGAYNNHKKYIMDALAKLNPSQTSVRAALTRDLAALEHAKSGGPIFRSIYGDVGISTGKELAKVRAARLGTAGMAGSLGATGLLLDNLGSRPASNYFPQQGYYGQGGIYGSDNPLSV